MPTRQGLRITRAIVEQAPLGRHPRAATSEERLPARGALREHAVRTLREALRLDAEGVVEARPVVLPRDRRRQLDELSLGEVLS